MTTFVTFGQEHEHIINGKYFNKDSVAVISSDSKEEGRGKAFEFFNRKFCFEYFNEEWDEEKKLPYFKRGYISVD